MTIHMRFHANLYGINTRTFTFKSGTVPISGAGACEVCPTGGTYLDTLRHDFAGARVSVRHHEKDLLRLSKLIVEIEVAGS
jgi:hypothetical protein